MENVKQPAGDFLSLFEIADESPAGTDKVQGEQQRAEDELDVAQQTLLTIHFSFRSVLDTAMKKVFTSRRVIVADDDFLLIFKAFSPGLRGSAVSN